MKARCWTKAVLPQPTGPHKHTGLPVATPKAKLFKLPIVESSSTKFETCKNDFYKNKTEKLQNY
jgi:hypothetical protein